MTQVWAGITQHGPDGQSYVAITLIINAQNCCGQCCVHKSCWGKIRIRSMGRFSMIQIRIRAFSMIQIRIRVFSMILIRIRAFSMIQIRITQRHIPGGLGTVLLLTCSKSDQVRQNDADPTGSGFATLVSTLILLTLYSFPKPIFLSYCCFLYTDKTVRKSIKSVLKISNCKLM